MSTMTSSESLAILKIDESLPPTLQLKAAAQQTSRIYLEKEQEQFQKIEQMRRALEQAKRRGLALPARRFEDDESLYNEGVEIPIRIALLGVVDPHQTTRPVYRLIQHWRIDVPETRLYLTKHSTFAREIPSVIKANTMTEELSYDHPFVISRFDDILTGLDSACVALRYV